MSTDAQPFLDTSFSLQQQYEWTTIGAAGVCPAAGQFENSDLSATLTASPTGAQVGYLAQDLPGLLQNGGVTKVQLDSNNNGIADLNEDSDSATYLPLDTNPSPIGPGGTATYTLRITSASGAVEYPFDLRAMDHHDSLFQFGFSVPHPGTLLGLEILHNGQVLLSQGSAQGGTGGQKSASLRSAEPQVQLSESGAMLTVQWDAQAHPYLMVGHVGAQRSTLAVDARGGMVQLSLDGVPAGGHFELGLSDGLNTVRLERAR